MARRTLITVHARGCCLNPHRPHADDSLVKRILLLCAALLLVAAPVADAKKPSKHAGTSAKACKSIAKAKKKAECEKKAAKATAERRCRGRRETLGEAAFRARYGGKRNAYGKCVSQQAKAEPKKSGPKRRAADDEDLDDESLDEELEDEELDDELDDRDLRDDDEFGDEDELDEDPDAGLDDGDEL
jgi:RNA polymerase primary sigma factor